MGVFHEETIDRSPISGSHQGLGNRAADYRHSAGRAGRWATPGGVRNVAGVVERGGVTGSQSRMGGHEGNLPEGFERVAAVLPEHQAFIVKKWAEDAKKKQEPKK